MNAQPKIDRETALAHVALVTGDADTPMNFRMLHDADKSADAIKLHGPLAVCWSEINHWQARGYGAFVVVNKGGNTDAEITLIRAVFIDADNVRLPNEWHLRPDFIIQRDSTHWHAYWRVFDLPV